jgi:hypothetical protein
MNTYRLQNSTSNLIITEMEPTARFQQRRSANEHCNQNNEVNNKGKEVSIQ